MAQQYPEMIQALSENQNNPIHSTLVYHTLRDLLNYPVQLVDVELINSPFSLHPRFFDLMVM